MKFREMSRLGRTASSLSEEEIKQVLSSGFFGVLSTQSQHGFPMSVPVCYIYHNDSIYFHTSNSGEKIDNITVNSQVSFLIYRQTDKKNNPLAGTYESVLIYGNAVLLHPSEEEARDALKAMAMHFSMPHKSTEPYIDAATGHFVASRIDTVHKSGKRQFVF